jgi:hypothetical protein
MSKALRLLINRLRSLINATLYPDPDDRALSLAILRQSTNLGCIVGATGFG